MIIGYTLGEWKASRKVIATFKLEFDIQNVTYSQSLLQWCHKFIMASLATWLFAQHIIWSALLALYEGNPLVMVYFPHKGQ